LNVFHSTLFHVVSLPTERAGVGFRGWDCYGGGWAEWDGRSVWARNL